MPKDEFDFEDPLELHGIEIGTDEDTSRDMAECFAEEFARMGFPPMQILALFRNPYYLGMNLVYRSKGEPFVREVIGDVFARWGRRVDWPAPPSARVIPLIPGGAPAAPLPVPKAAPVPLDPFGDPAPLSNL